MTPSSLSLLPVVVLYRCRWEDARVARTLLHHYSEAIFVGDNSPVTFDSHETQLPSNIHYHRFPHNPGLSHLYNLAAQYAAQHGYSHLLLLDQDTQFPPDALQYYLNLPPTTIVAAPTLRTTHGAFSPATIDTWNIRAVTLSAGEHSLFQFAPVNSGLCVRVADFLAVGGYNERVALDFADFQFIRRLRQQHPSFVLLPFSATQDFSNDCTTAEQLLPRFRLYLKSARHCQFASRKARWQHHYQVLRHSLSLTLRTHSPRFLTLFTTDYLLRS